MLQLIIPKDDTHKTLYVDDQTFHPRVDKVTCTYPIAAAGVHFTRLKSPQGKKVSLLWLLKERSSFKFSSFSVMLVFTYKSNHVIIDYHVVF